MEPTREPVAYRAVVFGQPGLASGVVSADVQRSNKTNMRIIFARTHYEYGSYQDYWRLVNLSGFETCYVDEIDLSADAIYIVSPINGEFRPHIDHHRSLLKEPQRAKIVWWNLERPDVPGSPSIQDVVTDILQYADAVWVSDRYYASLDSRMQHVVLGGDKNLCKSTTREPAMYDYTHQSYVVGRRAATHSRLQTLGLIEGPNGWGDERDFVMQRSRIMMNIHQTDEPIGEPIRFAVTAAHKLPMISESNKDPYPLVAGKDYIDVPLNELVCSVQKSVTDGGSSMIGIGESLFHRLCIEWTFRRGVEAGVAATGWKSKQYVPAGGTENDIVVVGSIHSTENSMKTLEDLSRLSADVASKYHSSFDNRPEWLRKMKGGMDPAEKYYLFLYYLTLDQDLSRCLEIGTSEGTSTMHMAHSLNFSLDGQKKPSTGRITTVDVDQSCKLKVDEMATAHGLENVKAITADSSQLAIDDQFDLLFIDGNHTLESAYGDYLRFRPLVRDGGVIVFDDTRFNAGMTVAWNHIVDPKMELPQMHYMGFGVAIKNIGAPAPISLESVLAANPDAR